MPVCRNTSRENGKGYTKEANFISWNGNAAKLDIRITSAAARVSRSQRTRAETFTPHSRQSMKKNNPSASVLNNLHILYMQTQF